MPRKKKQEISLSGPELEQQNQIRSLIKKYSNEVDSFLAIKLVWPKLKDDARSICALDFDEAFLSREIAMEAINTSGFLFLRESIFDADEKLLKVAADVKRLYKFDVQAYLGKPDER